MNKQIEVIEAQLAPLREKLTNHVMYSRLNSIEDVQTFMEKHVYAVWDFMSLLKALQQQLTCVQTPWLPAGNPKTARFINEIVLGEESDLDENGEPASHFEMYLDAMKEVGANTEPVQQFIASLTPDQRVSMQLEFDTLGTAEKTFMQFTFAMVESGEVHKIASAFTFGREDVIPDMFLEIINQSNEGEQVKYPKLLYYLKRHIELDGDEHGPLSLEMISELCGTDEKKWREVEETAIAALNVRIALWDAIALELSTSVNT